LSLLPVQSHVAPRWAEPQRPHLDHIVGCTEAQLLFNLSDSVYVGTQHLSASEVYVAKPTASQGERPYFVDAGGNFGAAPESDQSFSAALVAAPPNDSLHGGVDVDVGVAFRGDDVHHGPGRSDCISCSLAQSLFPHVWVKGPTTVTLRLAAVCAAMGMVARSLAASTPSSVDA
jgi:hypothetical protein